MNPQQPWWQTTTLYQIYPRSFADSNDDGIGDLGGIIAHLDYLHDLGFETIWISPFFCSPQQDWGYDVSDYLSVAPEYGRLADAEALIEAAHARGMRLLFDLVLNHTSSQHPWFQQSRSSRANPRRDWYLWRDGRGKNPPNNWKAIPGGPGWHYDQSTDQWYFASFLPFQPDLNWRNPAVKKAMFDTVRFWLAKGVDGFRLDIFHSIYKDAKFRDNPFSFQYIPGHDNKAGFFQQWKYTLNQPETFALAKELRALVDEYVPERLLIGELFGDDVTLNCYLGERGDGLHLAFLWELLAARPKAAFFRKVIEHHERHYPAPRLPVYVFGNHDQKRILSRFNGDPRLARLLALFQFTARGVPVTYYGEEIGMLDGNFPASTSLDPIGRRYSRIPPWLLDWLGLYVNRDGCRTPMQWNSSPHAGFCSAAAAPWLPVHSNRIWANVQDQQADPDSILNTYRRLLHLRREHPALQRGALELTRDAVIDKTLLAYARSGDGERLQMVINFSEKTACFQAREGFRGVLLAVGMEAPPASRQITLPALSGLILEI